MTYYKLKSWSLQQIKIITDSQHYGPTCYIFTNGNHVLKFNARYFWTLSYFPTIIEISTYLK